MTVLIVWCANVAVCFCANFEISQLCPFAGLTPGRRPILVLMSIITAESSYEMFVDEYIYTN